jgi:hypothetical protein
VKLARISLQVAPPTFRVAPGHAARISLAWWDDSEPEGRRDPVLVASPGYAARTLVIVWPTDSRGYVHADRVRRGEVEVLPWDLTDEDLERLRERARFWPLDLHDLLVWQDKIAPCPETLRSESLGIGLKDRVDAAIARLEG